MLAPAVLEMVGGANEEKKCIRSIRWTCRPGQVCWRYLS